MSATVNASSATKPEVEIAELADGHVSLFCKLSDPDDEIAAFRDGIRLAIRQGQVERDLGVGSPQFLPGSAGSEPVRSDQRP